MHTLPRIEKADHAAALACPDCAGTLTVREEGPAGHLHFQCRIGHGYSMGSLLAAKEDALEHWLWSALVSIEELASLLEDLHRLGQPYTAGAEWTAAAERIAVLRGQATAVRAVIDGNARIDLGVDAGPERERPC
jgi:two-component system, chemotaxis family, protein-glutamate methylesterase/glutaminase